MVVQSEHGDSRMEFEKKQINKAFTVFCFRRVQDDLDFGAVRPTG